MRRYSVRRHDAAGFSMIEVLITLVVLAFGLLGLALLQTMNLRYTKSANQRTQAVNLAGELLDMMRSNRSELAGYEIASTSLTGVDVSDGCATEAVLGATSNVERWKCEVAEALGTSATVAVDTSAAPTVKINVRWDESNVSTLTGQGEIRLETKL